MHKGVLINAVTNLLILMPNKLCKKNIMPLTNIKIKTEITTKLC